MLEQVVAVGMKFAPAKLRVLTESGSNIPRMVGKQESMRLLSHNHLHARLCEARWLRGRIRVRLGRESTYSNKKEMNNNVVSAY
jgi:hypothetical protein